jgi:hypothetical protein
MALIAEDALSDLPVGLRGDLLAAFNEVVRNYREHRWEPAELNGGKLCEAAYTIVVGALDGTYASRSSKPKDIVAACRALEQRPSGPRSFRVQIPRVLVALYEIRNNRGVGHAGAEVDPNHMDAVAVLYMSKWLMAELVRALHSSSTEEATELVESLVEREVALVWTMGDRKRVLKPGLTWKERMLLLLLDEPAQVAESDLVRWLEHPDAARLRRDVLRPAHRDALVDYDAIGRTIRLLPPGVDAAETLVAAT